jgi:hypothetical protein
MMSRRVQKAIVATFLIVGVALIAVDVYFYQFYSTHIVDHFAPETGNIYEVVMNGRTVFLTRSQYYFDQARWCGIVLAFLVAVYLSDRWKLGTPRSII